MALKAAELEIVGVAVAILVTRVLTRILRTDNRVPVASWQAMQRDEESVVGSTDCRH